MKLSISIDMGAKNNGVFISTTDKQHILNKKAFTLIIEKNHINFSKKSRRENRHRVRNNERKKLAKKLLWQFLDKNLFNSSQIELIQGLLNNRGYTFLSTSSEFEEINIESMEFLNNYIPELKDLKTKEDFEAKISEFENIETFINKITNKLNEEYNKKKAEFYKEYQENHSIIKKDLKLIRDFFNDILKEIKTGSKPRKKYLQEIKEEINNYNFIDDKKKFFNLIGNISNLQLRILRKLINKKDYKTLQNYFSMFHWNYNDREKQQKKELFQKLKKHSSLEEFFYNTSAYLTIPPYEDMNNRNTYKCNSLLINPKYITSSIKESIEILQKQPEFEILNLDKLSDSQKLQRILDINSKIIDSKIYPRNIFKYDKGDINYYKKLLNDNFSEFSNFAKKYYKLESKAINGIHNDGLLIKCNKNTPSKNNFKHILLSPLFEYNFTPNEADKLIEKIKSIKGLQTHLKKISDTAKEYQNSFYNHIEACFENKKCLNDKNIKDIIKNLDKDLEHFKTILKNTYLNKIAKIDKTNLKRVLNIFKQTYEILFKDINGFNKTCKTCTIENNQRNEIAKRILSDVAKPIDGMLDMMLDRIAWEIVSQIDNVEKDVEIILEQNRFLFESHLASIKGKKPKKREIKDILNLNICPYTGENITDTNGEYDHILPQSKELFNSKANLIYVSSKGNREKSNNRYYLAMLNKKHLKEIFRTDNISEIEKLIKENLSTIDEKKFTNFDNLKLKQQIALRYALFLDESSAEFQKAKKIISKDKIKTITNGTQKRLARLIFEKLIKKFNTPINCNVKVINNFLISATRKHLAYEMLEYDEITGEVLFDPLSKQTIQNSHSHTIDAMIAFYLANATIKGRYHQKQYNLSSLNPIFKFEDIYLQESKIINITKKQTFINTKDISSYQLFQDTIYSENYHHINSDFKDINSLIKYNLIYENIKNKKHFITNKNELKNHHIYKIDVDKTSKLLFELFEKNDTKSLKELKFLDKLRYNTTRADILNIFFDDKQTKLLTFEKISKKIPPKREKTFKAIYKILSTNNIFKHIEDKQILDKEIIFNLLKELFKLQTRKRDKKRHIFSLPILGQNAKYRVRRKNIIQILGGENIATKTYIVNNTLKSIPYFTKNVIPLKISDLISCNIQNSTPLYEINIDVSDKKEINSLIYLLTEASRLTVIVEFDKKEINFDFNSINTFDGNKDENFKKFIQEYLNSEKLKNYIGNIRDNLKGKATLIDNNSNSIILKYKAEINLAKKEIILQNYETYNNK